jgi:hypothetical protein
MSPWVKNFLEDFKRDGMMIASGITVLVLLCFTTYCAVYVEVKNKEIVNMLFGGIYTLAGGIVGYYYGSSKGSADKTKIMADKSNTSE